MKIGFFIIVLMSILLGSLRGIASTHPLFTKVKYNLETRFEDLNYLLHRADYTLNDHETLDLNGSLVLDNQQSFKVTLEPRFRYDFLDNNRIRFIPNNAYFLIYSEHTEFYSGLRTMTWGVSNFYNPTDVLNRKDYESNFYNPEKLGEVMVGAKFMAETFGSIKNPTIELIALPYLQETPFPKNNTRFAFKGTQQFIQFSLEDYQDISDNYFDNIGFATKLSGTIGSTDSSLLFYQGPDHDPAFYLRLHSDGSFRLTPYYYTVQMLGLNTETSLGEIVFHLETAYKITSMNAPKHHDVLIANDNVIPTNYFQFIPGLEHMWSGIFKTKGDLNLALEYLSEAGAAETFQETRPFKHDLFLGAKYSLNDKKITEFEMGVIKDILNQECVGLMRASTKLVKNVRLGTESILVVRDSADTSILSFFENNSYFSAYLSYNWGGTWRHQ